jgi:hypothetical protein
LIDLIEKFPDSFSQEGIFMSIIFFNFFGSRHAADPTGHGAGFIRQRSLADLFARGLWRIYSPEVFGGFIRQGS